MEWMIMPFKRYADFSGRSRRMEYWMFMLLNIIVYAVFGGLFFAVGGSIEAIAGDASDDGLGALGIVISLLLGLYVLAIIIPSIAVAVRRLHDRDMSGWWYLGIFVGSLIPLIGILFSIAFLILMLLPGTEGANRFGEDPKNPNSADTFA